MELLSYSDELLIPVLRHLTLPSVLQLEVDCLSALETLKALPFAVLALMDRSSCNPTHIKTGGNLGPIIERLHGSLVSIGTVYSALPASMAHPIARRELTLPLLEELHCMLNVNNVTDLKAMVEDLWSNGEGGSDRRRVFRCKWVVPLGQSFTTRAAYAWEAEMTVLSKRLSIEGEVDIG